MRKALIVGINHYDFISPLYGCVNDAHAVKEVLEVHGNNKKNFDVKLLTATGDNNKVDKKTLKNQIKELFESEHDVVFYFSGHGHIENTGGYLITSDCKEGDQGMPLFELMDIANKSKAKNKIIILDSCHSGFAGNFSSSGNEAILSKGTTILTASSAKQYATEKNGSGVFTSLLVDALNGGASNLIGKITPASIYAHIDQSLGSWQQRPLFKTNLENFISLRDVQPPIPHSDLIKITSLFPEKENEFKLNPTFEFTDNSAIKKNVENFKILQKYQGIRLVIPLGEEHMYFAAMNSKSCRLTTLGQHYWKLVNDKRI